MQKVSSVPLFHNSIVLTQFSKSLYFETNVEKLSERMDVGIPLISTKLDIALRVADIDIASVNSKWTARVWRQVKRSRYVFGLALPLPAAFNSKGPAKSKPHWANALRGFWKRQLGSADICCFSRIAKYLWQVRHFDLTVCLSSQHLLPYFWTLEYLLYLWMARNFYRV